MINREFYWAGIRICFTDILHIIVNCTIYISVDGRLSTNQIKHIADQRNVMKLMVKGDPRVTDNIGPHNAPKEAVDIGNPHHQGRHAAIRGHREENGPACQRHGRHGQQAKAMDRSRQGQGFGTLIRKSVSDPFRKRLQV